MPEGIGTLLCKPSTSFLTHDTFRYKHTSQNIMAKEKKLHRKEIKKPKKSKKK